MHQTFQNWIDLFFYSLNSYVSYWDFSWLEYSWEWNCRAIWWVRVPFEKKSVDTGFVPVTEVLKAEPILWHDTWKRMKSGRKEASSRNHGRYIKAWTRISSWHQRDKLITLFSSWRMIYGKGWKAVEKKHLIENMGSILKLGLKIQCGILSW